jgi:hypothetical protein
MKIMDLIALAESFAKEAENKDQPATTERFPETEKSPTAILPKFPETKAIINSIYTFAYQIIDRNFGDDVSKLHKQGRFDYQFSIITASANSFHLYRKLAQFIQSTFNTKHKIDTGEKMVFYYPDHAISLVMANKEIKVHITTSHSESKKHKETTSL